MATLWGPDSCECRIVYVANPDGTVSYQSTETTCALHAGLSGANLLSVLLSENQSKNKMAAEILARIPRLGVTVTNPDGGTYVDWADGVSFLWSFTGNGNARQLRVEVVGAKPPLTTQEKGQIKAAAAGMTTTTTVA